MRRSGSSSCMLRPKSSVDSSESSEQLSVTVMNTQMLPTYSTERYYMLSEIEQHGYTTQFLSEMDDCDKTDDTVATSESYEPSSRFPPFVLLYLLWRPGEFPSAKSFVEGPVKHAVKRLQNLAEVASDREPPSPLHQSEATESHETRVYLIVDIVKPYEAHDQHNHDEMRRQRHHQVKIKDAEQLARNAAVSEELRSILLGITVGLSDDPRAAPGLESCLEAISFGSKDRRKRKGSRSAIGVVCPHREDLLGVAQQAETEAVQGIYQSTSCAEWNGNGNLQSFARRAHTYWRVQNEIPESRDAVAIRKSLHLRKRLAMPEVELDHHMGAEHISTWMIYIFAVVVVSYLWQLYGDEFVDFLSEVLQSD